MGKPHDNRCTPDQVRRLSEAMTLVQSVCDEIVTESIACPTCGRHSQTDQDAYLQRKFLGGVLTRLDKVIHFGEKGRVPPQFEGD